MSPVFRELLRRELAERQQGSVLGVGWWFLLPLLQLGLFALVFGALLPARDGGALPYPAFLALGLWPWWLLANAVARGLGSYTDNAALIGRVPLPVTVYVDARVAASVLLDLLGFALVVGVLALFGLVPAWRGIPLLLIALLLAMVLAWALARIVGLLQVFLRDVGPMVTQGLGLAFFLTPVLYPREHLPAALASVLAWNPMAAVIEAVRAAWSSGGEANWLGLLPAVVVTGVVVLLAVALQRRAAPHVEDFL